MKSAVLSELAISIHYKQIAVNFPHLKKNGKMGNYIKRQILTELMNPENLLSNPGLEVTYNVIIN